MLRYLIFSSLKLKKIGNIPAKNLIGLNFNQPYVINADLSTSPQDLGDDGMVASMEGILGFILILI